MTGFGGLLVSPDQEDDAATSGGKGHQVPWLSYLGRAS